MLVSRWRAYMVISRIPASERPQLHLKVLTVDALNQRRSHWGCERQWQGDYLRQVKKSEFYEKFWEKKQRIRKNELQKFGTISIPSLSLIVAGDYIRLIE